METPLHYINLLDNEKRTLVLVWTFATLVILISLGYVLTTISTVSKIAFLLDFEIAKNFTLSVLILTYLGMTSMAVFFVKENNYLRNAVGELYAI
jgi:FtsH-binding integral membrane protein